MRWVICAVVVLALPSSAFAGDFDILRGPVATTNWAGFYAGGQIGADYNSVDFSSVATPYINTISTLDANFNGIPLTHFPQLGSLNTTKASYGFYVGYNVQFEDAVIGLELNLNKTSLNAIASNTASHTYFQTANSTVYDTTYNVNTSAAAAIQDYGTFRARFGWAFDQFLPYAFGGISVAQVNASSSVNVNYCGQESPYTCTNPPPASSPPPPAPIGGNWTLSDSSHGKYYYGFDAGVGLQWMLMPHVFLRGELEYIRFGSPDAIRLGETSARLGGGVQF